MNIDKLQQKLIRTTAMNAAVLVMFTLTQIIFFKSDGLINDDGSDLMSCFQSFLGLGMPGISI